MIAYLEIVEVHLITIHVIDAGLVIKPVLHVEHLMQMICAKLVQILGHIQ